MKKMPPLMHFVFTQLFSILNLWLLVCCIFNLSPLIHFTQYFSYSFVYFMFLILFVLEKKKIIFFKCNTALIILRTKHTRVKQNTKLSSETSCVDRSKINKRCMIITSSTRDRRVCVRDESLCSMGTKKVINNKKYYAICPRQGDLIWIKM